MKSTVDLYLNADKTKVVLADDLTASSLLVNAGREIPDAEVTAMGAGILEQAQALGNPTPVEAPAENKAADAEQDPETKQEEPGEDKAVEAPAENKAAGKGNQKSK